MPVQVIEKKGKSIDEAIKAALDELQCAIDDVNIEIVEEPTRGLLGFVGKKPAVVKVSLREKPERDARQTLEELLQRMKIDYQITAVDCEGGRVRINITGKDMGLLIGRKGKR